MDSNIVLVKDINPTPDGGDLYTAFNSSSPRFLTEFKDLLYFSASKGEIGQELWVSNGTAEGTQLVADIRPNNGESLFVNGSNPREFIEFSDRLYFRASDRVSNEELWVTDGTTEGTKLVKDIYPSDSESDYQNSSYAEKFTVAGDRLFFSAENGENGRELWVSDGTTEGTKLVKDINPGITDSYFPPIEPRVDSSIPQELTAVGNLIYFTANDGENGRELWVSDGTTQGTKLVKDINPGFDNSEYIYAKIGKSRRLEPRPLGSNPEDITEFNGKLYFSADDGTNGRELWVSDGTAEGTMLLADINPTVNEFSSISSSYPNSFIEFQDRLYFSANNGEQGDELWVTDGTTEGTQLVADINPNTTPNYFGFVQSSSAPRYFATFDNKLFFTADDDSVGRELWVSDGTSEGTKLVKDIEPNIDTFSDGRVVFPEGSGIYGFTEFNGRLYFTADTNETGRELWVTDGTTEGTQLVEDLYPGSSEGYSFPYPNSSSPDFLTVVGNELFFAADNGETGTELFKLTAEDFNSENPDSTDKTTSSSASVSEDGRSVSVSSSSFDRTESGRSSSSSSNTIESMAGNVTLTVDAGRITSSSSSFDRTESGTSSASSSDSVRETTNFEAVADVEEIAGSVTLTGGDGGDSFTGNSGDDLLDGNLGDDTLTGGGGADVFVLRAGDGTDTITDFELGTDRLGLGSGLQFDDLTFSGQSILAGEEVLADLNGVNTEQLTSDDFDFI